MTVLITIVIIGVVLLSARALANNPERLRYQAKAERDLHTARRGREADELQQTIERDARRLREVLRRELRDGQ